MRRRACGSCWTVSAAPAGPACCAATSPEASSR
jgi:hypothetical protein